MADYTILLRNPRTLALLGELPVFLHARWRRHQREMGDFEITVNRNNVADDLIARNNIVEIRRDGEFEFAGIIRYREIGDPVLGGQRGDVWKLSGPDLKWWLTNRLVDPGASQYDSQVGVATETALKHYVEDHLTAPADADRDVNTELAAGITFEVQPDASRGIDANFNGRFDNLLGGCLLPLARGADLLHDVVLLSDYSGYRYEVSEPTDATGTVTFSVGWDNVEKLIYREDYLSVRNSMYVLGQGAGAARTVEVVEDADGIAQDFRREGPIDARQADTVAKLQQVGNDRLESLLDDSLSAHAVPAIVGPTLYRQDWDVGYDVTVSISEVGIEMTRRIVEVIVQLTRDKGEDISISLGSRPKTQTRQIAEGQQRTNPVMHDGGGGGGGGYDTIEDEGVPLAQRTTIDFRGAGVTAADVAGETRVTIPGAVSAPHNLLDGVTHPDTVAQAVSAGSLVYGDNTPDWNELVRVVPGGAALRNVLGLDQGDTVPAWKAALDAVNPANIAAAASPGTSLLFSHRDHIHAHVDIAADLHTVYFLASGARAATGNLDFGAFYQDIGEIVVPANPGANIRRLFVDQATGEISVRTSAGATVSLEGGGGGTPTLIEDADQNTKIQTEESADENIIRMDVAGTERVVIQDSSPFFSITGDLEVSAQAAIGGDSSITPGDVLSLDETYTLGLFGVGTGLGGTIKCDGTQANTFGPRAIDLLASTEQTGGNVLIAIGMQFIAEHNQTVTTSTLRGFSLAGKSTGTGACTTLEGMLIANNVGASGGVPTDNRELVIRGTTKGTTVYGVEINDISNAANTTTYGLKIDDFANGTNKRLVEVGPSVPYFRVPGDVAAVSRETPIYISWGTAAPAWALKQLKTMDPGAGGANFAGGEEVCILV